MKQIICVAAAVSALLSTEAVAQTRGGFEAGGEVFAYQYRESIDNQDVVRDDGTFFGVHLGYTETLSHGWFLRGSLAFAFGSVNYRGTGSVLDDNDGTEARIDGVRQAIGRGELHIGKDLAFGGATLTPFLGLGSRVLVDGSGGEATDTGLQGYDREISYAYVPVGAVLRAQVGRGAAVVLSGQYNALLGGTAKSEFSTIDPQLPDIEVELQGGHGYELSAAVETSLGRTALRVGPYLRGWSIDRSESFVILNPDDPSEGLELFEPKNRTTELGLRLTMAF